MIGIPGQRSERVVEPFGVRGVLPVQREAELHQTFHAQAKVEHAGKIVTPLGDAMQVVRSITARDVHTPVGESLLPYVVGIVGQGGSATSQFARSRRRPRLLQ